MPFKMWSPRSSNTTLVEVRARLLTVSEIRISPGTEEAAIRAAILTAPPNTFLPSLITSPAWIPMCSLSSVPSEAALQWIAHSIAWRAEVNTAMTPSPSSLPSTSLPPVSVMIVLSESSSWRAYPRNVVSPNCSVSTVESAISAKRMVTVPSGSLASSSVSRCPARHRSTFSASRLHWRGRSRA